MKITAVPWFNSRNLTIVVYTGTGRFSYVDVENIFSALRPAREFARSIMNRHGDTHGWSTEFTGSTDLLMTNRNLDVTIEVKSIEVLWPDDQGGV